MRNRQGTVEENKYTTAMASSSIGAVTKGVTYFLKHLYVQKILYVDFTMKSLGTPLILQRGPGFLKREAFSDGVVTGETLAESGFIPPWHSDRKTLGEPTPNEVMDAVNKFYGTGYDGKAAMENELNGVVFAGYGDPLCRLEDLLETCKMISTRRPGAPIRINSLGLVESEKAFEVASSLKQVGVETVSVSLGADSPVAYNKIIEPQNGLGFGNVCNFIIALQENGISVTCSAVEHPDVSIPKVRALSESLGADFKSRTYHP